MAYGLLTLHPEHYERIQGGPSQDGEPIACVGAGTGLGVAFLTADVERIGVDPSAYVAFPSEGGHVDWSPRDDLEAELHRFIKAKTNAAHRCSTERIVSGPGLRAIYDFLRQHRDYKPHLDRDLDAQICASSEATAGGGGGDLIAKSANCSNPNKVCEKALQIFMGAYGAACGSAALTFLPRGGLFIVGGIAPKNMNWLVNEGGSFRRAFRDKGRQWDAAIKDVPVNVVTHQGCGLRGAHVVAYRELLKLDGQADPRAQRLLSAAGVPPLGKGRWRTGSMLSAVAVGAGLGLVLSRVFARSSAKA